MKVTTLGIDLAKSIFQLHGVDERGNVAIQKRVTRNKLRETVAQLPRCVIRMEACGSAQYGAREFQQLSHTVKTQAHANRPVCLSNTSVSLPAIVHACIVTTKSVSSIFVNHDANRSNERVMTSPPAQCSAPVCPSVASTGANIVLIVKRSLEEFAVSFSLSMAESA